MLLGFAKSVWRLGNYSFHGAHDLSLAWGERLLDECLELLARGVPRWRPGRELLIAKIHEQERTIRDLHLDLAAMVGRATGLDDLVIELRRRLQARQEGGRDPLYVAVGLDASAPDFIVKGARREFRKNLHPDTKPASQKAEATRVFQEAENVFDQIYRRRGFR